MNKLLFFSFSFFIILANSCSLNSHSDKDSSTSAKSNFRIMFYNTENLFDTFDDPDKNDAQFLPEGDKHWNDRKYQQKLIALSKVIVAAGEWKAPAIIGVCEIENDRVLHDLSQESPLKKWNYQYLHKESPDRRGIDVALFYQKDQFQPIKTQYITINFPEHPHSKTRDILYCKGVALNKDTLHVFINHWPSRWGGQMKTESKRIFLAQTLRKKVDSLFQNVKNPNIIILGDLNDTPEDVSVLKYLKALPPEQPYQTKTLYNLMYPLSQTKEGTHPYHGHWAVLDHIIVSNNLLSPKNKVNTKLSWAHPFKKDFLLEEDKKYGGIVTFRTYIGFKYHGGYSDHLPVLLDLNIR